MKARTYICCICGKELNMPKGKIDFDTAVANLVCWEHRGWKVEIK